MSVGRSSEGLSAIELVAVAKEVSRSVWLLVAKGLRFLKGLSVELLAVDALTVSGLPNGWSVELLAVEVVLRLMVSLLSGKLNGFLAILAANSYGLCRPGVAITVRVESVSESLIKVV